MKRKTKFCVRITIRGSDPVTGIYREFSRIKNVRKFVKNYREIDLSYCWTDSYLINKEPIRMDRHYLYDPTDDRDKNWSKLTK